MSNYNNLKTTIDANIKQNGNQEITGPILNSVLNQMVNILGTGYQFAGIATLDPATEPGTPDAKVFYIANGKGTYTNFGGLEVTEDEVVVLYWDTAWHKVATGIASQAKLSELEKIKPQVESNTQAIKGIAVSGGASVASAVIFNNGENAEGRLGDRDADESQMGYVILRKRIPFAEQVTESNTIYEIRYNFSAGETPFNVPSNCVLMFKGGKITDGKIVGSNTKIDGILEDCFSVNVSFGGTFQIEHVSPSLFGAKPNINTYDSTPALEKCFELQTLSSGDVFIPQGDWNLLTPVSFIHGRMVLRGTGNGSRLLSATNHFDCGGRSVGGIIENLYFARSAGSSHYYGTCFENVEFSSIKISKVNVNNCGIFIRGIIRNSIIDGCNILGLGYSFISGYSESDYNSEPASKGTIDVCYDSRITNNYINCVSLSTMTTEKAVFSGGVSTTMFAHNYADYWKYIIRGNDATTIAHTHMNVFSNNMFDLCYTFFGNGYVHVNDFVFSDNMIFHVGWSQASGSSWGSYSTDEEVKVEQWIFLRLYSLDGVHIKGNVCRNFTNESYLLATVHNGYPSRFSDVDVLPRFHSVRFALKSQNPNEYRDIVFNGQMCAVDKDNLIYWDNHVLKSKVSYTKSFGTKTIFHFGNNYDNYVINSCRFGYYSRYALSNQDYTQLFSNGEVRDSSGYILTTINVNDVNYNIIRETPNKIIGVFAKDVPALIGELPLYQQVHLLGEDGSVIKTGDNSWDWSGYDGLSTRTSAVKTSIPTTQGYTGQIIWVNGEPYKYNGDTWSKDDVGLFCPRYVRGTTTQRPKLTIETTGYEYFDTDLGKKILWNGTAWVNMDGTALVE